MVRDSGLLFWVTLYIYIYGVTKNNPYAVLPKFL